MMARSPIKHSWICLTKFKITEMIPKQLTIEGIYSYQERQTIDFTELTDAGLFGIFGATGSGKSSILEAISYALYGQTERLNSRDKRTYNMMNLKSDRAYIAFDFYNYENELYRVTREFKRNTKNFEQIYTPDVTFYKFRNDTWTPVEHTNAQKIVGLSYDNFKRTIIIPQGQFREFLELTSTERTRMLKDIFQLQRYDLQDRVSRLRKENQSNLDKLTGNLQGFEDVTGEKIKTKEKEFEEADSHLKRLKKEHQTVDKKFQQLKSLKSDFDELKKKTSRFEELGKQQIDIKRTEKKVNNYERLYKAFHNLLADRKRYKTTLGQKQEQHKETKEKLEELKDDLAKKGSALEKIGPYFEKLTQKRAEEDDLGFITTTLGLLKEIKGLKKRGLNGEQKIKEAKSKVEGIQSNINSLEKEISGLKSRRLDAKLLREVGEWFSKIENLKENYQKQNKKVTGKKSKIQSLLQELEENNIDVDTFQEEHQAKVEELDIRKKKLTEKKERLKVQQKLAEHAHSLHDGKACPLCGSLEHPDILEAKDVTSELQKITEHLDNIETQKKILDEKRSEADKKREQKRMLDGNLKSEKEQLQAIDKELEEHRSIFKWDDFDPEKPEEFKAKQTQSEKLEKQIEKKENRLDKLRETEKKEEKNAEKYQTKLNKIEKAKHGKQAQVDANKANLKRLEFNDYCKKNKEEVEQLQKKLKKQNDKIEKRHQRLTKAIHDLKPKVASRKSTLESYEEQIEELNNDISSVRKQIEKKLEDEPVSDVEEVKQVLSQNIDVKKERKKIEEFNQNYKTLKSKIKDLKDKLAEGSFSEKLFQETEKKWEASKEKLDKKNEQVTKLKGQIERLQEDFKKKKKLQKKQEKLQKRADNLKTMFNLFKGSGFVEYVSSIYLSQLCDRANERFNQMTRNQLSLQLSEDNEFEIIDYLNEGRSRNVKTLSGGQSFQVSLSLALALAESVQSNTKADKNFFFIDEGFGTQDSDSVNIIFETLLNLNKENKIVGVISHVEELKDRIPQSLTITKDEEKGSLLSSN